MCHPLSAGNGSRFEGDRCCINRQKLHNQSLRELDTHIYCGCPCLNKNGRSALLDAGQNFLSLAGLTVFDELGTFGAWLAHLT